MSSSTTQTPLDAYSVWRRELGHEGSVLGGGFAPRQRIATGIARVFLLSEDATGSVSAWGRVFGGRRPPHIRLALMTKSEWECSAAGGGSEALLRNLA
jgi:hypothetical protein